MIEQFVNFVIRPPRAEYNPDQYLWEPEFTLAGRKYKRLDLEASKGHNYVDFLVSFICEDLVLTIDIIAC